MGTYKKDWASKSRQAHESDKRAPHHVKRAFSVTQTRFNTIILNLAQTHKVSLGDLIFISDYALNPYIEFDSEDLGISQAPVCTYMNSVEKRELSILRRLSDKSHGIGISNHM